MGLEYGSACLSTNIVSSNRGFIWSGLHELPGHVEHAFTVGPMQHTESCETLALDPGKERSTLFLDVEDKFATKPTQKKIVEPSNLGFMFPMFYDEQCSNLCRDVGRAFFNGLYCL